MQGTLYGMTINGTSMSVKQNGIHLQENTLN